MKEYYFFQTVDLFDKVHGAFDACLVRWLVWLYDHISSGIWNQVWFYMETAVYETDVRTMARKGTWYKWVPSLKQFLASLWSQAWRVWPQGWFRPVREWTMISPPIPMHLIHRRTNKYFVCTLGIFIHISLIRFRGPINNKSALVQVIVSDHFVPGN